MHKKLKVKILHFQYYANCMTTKHYWVRPTTK